jgi:hypothetical protein
METSLVQSGGDMIAAVGDPIIAHGCFVAARRIRYTGYMIARQN